MRYLSEQSPEPHASQRQLFALAEAGESMSNPLPDNDLSAGIPRLRQADRAQVEFRACCWNDLLPADHQACIVWQYVSQMDLSPLLAKIKSVRRTAGHPAPDPRILVA